MTIRRVCDVCEHISSEEIRELPEGWTHVGVSRREASPTEGAKMATINVVLVDCCPVCGELITERIKVAVGEVKDAAS